MAPLAETLSYSNSIVKINLGIANHKIQRYNGASDTNFEMKAKYFTGLQFYSLIFKLKLVKNIARIANAIQVTL